MNIRKVEHSNMLQIVIIITVNYLPSVG